MDIAAIVKMLRADGYNLAQARAKVAHDVVLAAIKRAGMKDKITIKGGVVMSSLTKSSRRATMDMDVDLVHYSLSDHAIQSLIKKLNGASDCTIEIYGEIKELRQQEYRGKRVFLLVTDARGAKAITKVDLGVHTKMEVKQKNLSFDLVADERSVKLLANSKEQIFVEKLKSMLRLGTLSSRYKDVYDMYYLMASIKKPTLRRYIEIYIYQDHSMRERNPEQIASRLEAIFSNRQFLANLRKKKFAWIDGVTAQDATSAIIKYLAI